MSEAAAKPRVPKRPPPPAEVTPIIGGRLWIAIAILLALSLIANPKFNQEITKRFAPKEPYTDVKQWIPGQEGDVRVTVITADAHRLACGHDKEIGGAHCGFRADTKPWPKDSAVLDDNNVNVIQPYRTSPDNQLILLAGLWATPAVAMRLHREPPQGVPVKRLQRFEARCKVKFLEKIESVKLRWEPTAKWYTEKSAMVARAESCTVGGAS